MDLLPRGRGGGPFFDFDSYWEDLNRRVYKEKEELEGTERLFDRLSIIRGDLYTEGFDSYFQFQYDHFDEDQRYLEEHGFDVVAQALRDARTLLFGERELTHETIYDVLTELYDEEGEPNPLADQLQEMMDDVLPRLDEIQEFRDQLGLREGYYRKLEW